MQDGAYDAEIGHCQPFQTAKLMIFINGHSTCFFATPKGPAMTKRSNIQSMETMSDVREQVNRIDAELIALIAERFDCMDAAARIKQDRESVRDEERKAAVIENVKQLAVDANVPAPTMAAMWEMLVETSISYEFQQWDALRRK
ncbi:MAG: chorismate mutase [Pseudomonadota bacterium]